ncbi:MAG: twin-arginine translocase TatA/TatE family subunit [Nitrospiraceae bacterium]|nr:MAG: twin-arginine translocase TatA/TatE family subunit [Nitrospiraceae bacterium]
MFDLGAQELIVIFIVAFLVFGPKRLPELGRTLGKGMRELKVAMRNVKNSLDESDLNISKDINAAKSDIEKSFKDAVVPDIDIKPDTDKKEAAKEEPKVENQAGDLQANAVEEKKATTEPEKDG